MSSNLELLIYQNNLSKENKQQEYTSLEIFIEFLNELEDSLNDQLDILRKLIQEGDKLKDVIRSTVSIENRKEEQHQLFIELHRNLTALTAIQTQVCKHITNIKTFRQDLNSFLLISNDEEKNFSLEKIATFKNDLKAYYSINNTEKSEPLFMSSLIDFAPDALLIIGPYFFDEKKCIKSSYREFFLQCMLHLAAREKNSVYVNLTKSIGGLVRRLETYFRLIDFSNSLDNWRLNFKKEPDKILEQVKQLEENIEKFRNQFINLQLQMAWLPNFIARTELPYLTNDERKAVKAFVRPGIHLKKEIDAKISALDLYLSQIKELREQLTASRKLLSVLNQTNFVFNKPCNSMLFTQTVSLPTEKPAATAPPPTYDGH